MNYADSCLCSFFQTLFSFLVFFLSFSLSVLCLVDVSPPRRHHVVSRDTIYLLTAVAVLVPVSESCHFCKAQARVIGTLRYLEVFTILYLANCPRLLL
jgi:hypothetical protein